MKPSSLLHFHNALKKRKYRLLYSPRCSRKPGPKEPSKEVINAIFEIKQRNPRYGCPRIAQQINLTFGIELDKDTVRRVLAVHYKPDPVNQQTPLEDALSRLVSVAGGSLNQEFARDRLSSPTGVIGVSSLPPGEAPF